MSHYKRILIGICLILFTGELRATGIDRTAPSASSDLPRAESVTGFTLVNADTDQDIGPLTDGATVDLTALGTANLNVRANTDPATVGSVRFALNGDANFRTENVVPYALAGDKKGDYFAWTPATGTYTLTATPYTESNASGTAGTALTVTFEVVEGSATVDPPAAPVLESPSDGATGVSTSPTLTWNASDGATSYRVQVAPVSDFSSTVVDQSGLTTTSYALSGLAEGTTYYWRVLATNGGGDSPWSSVFDFTTEQTTSTGPVITSLTLVNADTDQDIGPLTDGATVDLTALGTANLNVRANTDPATVGSVRFALNGDANFRTENVAPYALAGDTKGDYFAWTPATGTYTLTATPYTESNASGTAGTALTVTFEVVEGGSSPQQVDARFVSSVADATLSVTIQVKAASQTNLGSSTLRFTFNEDALELPTSDGVHLSTDRYSFHRFSGSGEDGGTYSADVTRPTQGKASINIVFAPPSGGGGGDALPTTFTDVVTLAFSIVDATQPAALTWLDVPNETDLYETDNVTILPIGTFEDASPALSLTNATGVSSSSDLHTGEAQASIPKTYTLESNYPDPFNPSTTIRYSLPEDGRVVLEVFDMLGRRVAVLVDEVQRSGHHQVQFDATSLVSGTYLYRLRTPAFTSSKTMVLLK